MPKTRGQKNEILIKLKEKIGNARAIFFARYSKMTVEESMKLRNSLKSENSEFIVAPKTIANLAFKDSKLDYPETKKLEGQLALIIGYGDEVIPAKIVSDFKKENAEKIDFLAGILDGRQISASEVVQLAELPSKIELQAKLVGSLNAPISGFVNALAGNLRNLVYVLKAIEGKKA